VNRAFPCGLELSIRVTGSRRQSLSRFTTVRLDGVPLLPSWRILWPGKDPPPPPSFFLRRPHPPSRLSSISPAILLSFQAFRTHSFQSQVGAPPTPVARKTSVSPARLRRPRKHHWSQTAPPYPPARRGFPYFLELLLIPFNSTFRAPVSHTSHNAFPDVFPPHVLSCLSRLAKLPPRSQFEAKPVIHIDALRLHFTAF